MGAYHFSVAWPRVQPGGRGRANAAGLAFYDRLVDELLGAGVQPWVTLHHWDLPQELEDAGGWLSRDTAYRFEEYAFLVGERLADRAAAFMTLNAPSVVMLRGYAHGTHAPGRTLGLGRSRPRTTSCWGTGWRRGRCGRRALGRWASRTRTPRRGLPRTVTRTCRRRP